jgi:hypothetical protein
MSHVFRFVAIGKTEICVDLIGGVMEQDRLYSVKESAKFLGNISPWTIHSWLSKGRLARVKVGSEQ